jgi:CheY-like chemotaxis protein
MHTSGGANCVLVAEDCPDNAETLRVLLRLWGHDAVVVRDGNAAIAEAVRLRPKVALIDLGLPGTDGFEVARRLKNPPAEDVPVLVAVTGHVSRDDRRRAFDAGFDDFLPKPLDLDRLRSILASAINRAR